MARDGDPDIKPVSGEATEKAIPQAGHEMVVPAEVEEPGEVAEDARQGGRIYTCEYYGEETRPQELHSSVKYQEMTADPGEKPRFVDYVDLTKARGEVRG
jgi:hypothetical protein